MSSDIGPGDWAEYVGPPTGYASPDGPRWFVVGKVYRVSEVGRWCEDAAGQIWPSLRVAGQPLVGPRGRPLSAPVAAFRPVYRPKADLIESLKVPAKRRAKVDA